MALSALHIPKNDIRGRFLTEFELLLSFKESMENFQRGATATLPAERPVLYYFSMDMSI